MNYQKYTWYNRGAKIDNPLGGLDEIRTLKHEIGIEKIREVYLQHPKKIYSRTVFMFINNYILNNQEPIDERKYLKNTSRECI